MLVPPEGFAAVFPRAEKKFAAGIFKDVWFNSKNGSSACYRHLMS
jgi:hypothetical protein